MKDEGANGNELPMDKDGHVSTVLVTFFHCDKISEINTLKKKEVYFGSQFRAWSPYVFGFIAVRLAKAEWYNKRPQ